MTPGQLTRIRALSELSAKNNTIDEAIAQAAHLNPWQIAEAILLWKSLNKASKDGPDAAIEYLGGRPARIKTHSCIHVTKDGKTCERCGVKI